jgi:hypothetical protein
MATVLVVAVVVRETVCGNPGCEPNGRGGRVSYAEGLTGLNAAGLAKMAELRNELLTATQNKDADEIERIGDEMKDVANDPSYKN